MVYDDLIIGSGLTALATAYGLGPRNRVCVLAGSEQPELQWYDDTSRIPCANSGFGGLGAYWHGVIPMGASPAFFEVDRVLFDELFSRFYPQTLKSRFGQPWLFVPYRPIRPAQHWKKLCEERKNLSIINGKVDRIERIGHIWKAYMEGGSYQTRRIWLGAGALATPALLENSLGFSGSARRSVSDHVILYLGQLNRRIHQQVLSPHIERETSGVWMPASYDVTGTGLVTTKPARFSYATLDYGIEQRSAFGLPISGLLAKLCSAGSLGLISESLFNKLGLFPNADRLSAYAQIQISDAYQMNLNDSRLTPNIERIQKGIRDFRAALQWPELECTKKPNLFIRGIHLHNSVDMKVLAKTGALDDGNLMVVDASGIDNIGPEHHSFRMMVRAYSLAKGTQL
jgi:hypothetical protein